MSEDLFAHLAGTRIDGGCDDCSAYQEIERVSAGVALVHVFHDETCPWLLSRSS